MSQFLSWCFNFCNFIHPTKLITSVINYWKKLTRKIISKTERHLRMFENAGLRSSFFLEKTNTQRMLPRNNNLIILWLWKAIFHNPESLLLCLLWITKSPRTGQMFCIEIGETWVWLLLCFLNSLFPPYTMDCAIYCICLTWEIFFLFKYLILIK